MKIFLAILLIGFMAATVFFLIKEIVVFLKTTEEDLMGDGPNRSGELQNKAMQGRIAMQAIAIIVALLLLSVIGS